MNKYDVRAPRFNGAIVAKNCTPFKPHPSNPTSSKILTIANFFFNSAVVFLTICYREIENKDSTS